ncbi:MAG: hypothetical protein WC998_07520 [Candidatus Paceibacterota bacterium]|jgi:hypothetical protein
MKEHPILFSTKMVQAILARKKSMTRRIIKFPKDFTGEKVYDNYPFGLKYTSSLGGGTIQRLFPKWEVGDVLWVRETFAMSYDTEDHPELKDCPQEKWDTGYVYKADGKPFYMIDKWKPSIFMPRSACRILLEITDIKAELLKSISDEDVIKEGVRPDLATGHPEGVFYSAFMSLWDSIHGKGAHELNPWVRCTTFKINEVKNVS